MLVKFAPHLYISLIFTYCILLKKPKSENKLHHSCSLFVLRRSCLASLDKKLKKKVDRNKLIAEPAAMHFAVEKLGNVYYNTPE